MKKWMLTLLLFAINSQNIDILAIIGRYHDNQNKRSKKNHRTISYMKKLDKINRQEFRKLQQKVVKLEKGMQLSEEALQCVKNEIKELKNQHQEDSEGFIASVINVLASSVLSLAQLRLIFNYFDFDYQTRLGLFAHYIISFYNVNRRISPYFVRGSIRTLRTLMAICRLTPSLSDLLQENQEEEQEESSENNLQLEKI